MQSDLAQHSGGYRLRPMSTSRGPVRVMCKCKCYVKSESEPSMYVPSYEPDLSYATGRLRTILPPAKHALMWVPIDPPTWPSRRLNALHELQNV